MTSFSISAVLGVVATILFYVTGVLNEILNIVAFVGPQGEYDLDWVFISIPIWIGAVWFLGTFLLLLFLGKKSFSIKQYSYTILLALADAFIILAGVVEYCTPTETLWCAYAVVGIFAVLSTILASIINKKIPFMLAVILACVVGIVAYENSLPTASNERDTSVEQVAVVIDSVNLRESMDIYSSQIGTVNKGEIYTVLDSEIVEGTKWIQIQTGTGINGYIEFAKDGEQYCEYLPADKELQKELDAQRVKEEAEIKAAEDAVKALDGMWHWNDFYGYYVEFQNGALSYGTNAEKSDSSKEIWHKDAGTVVYDTKTKTYVIKDFIWAEKLTLDGGKIRMYDEYGELASFFDGYGTRVKN